MTITGRTAVTLTAILVVAGLAPALAAGDDDMVVVSRPGVVYHKAGSLDVRGRGHEKPLNEALASGYAPCPICFAGTGGSSGSAALLTTSASQALSRNVVIPPGLIGPSLLTQPFGLKIGTLYPAHGARDGVRDPYQEPRTITHPASEQGAYGGGSTR